MSWPAFSWKLRSLSGVLEHFGSRKINRLFFVDKKRRRRGRRRRRKEREREEEDVLDGKMSNVWKKKGQKHKGWKDPIDKLL